MLEKNRTDIKLDYIQNIQGAGRDVVAHLVQASELVANLTK
jgi:hypothetical protein